MNILFATENPYKHLNPYVSTLINGLKSIDNAINCFWGVNNFWSDNVLSYDIIHIMWPENLLTISFLEHKTANDLEDRLNFIKKHNIKIVSTCHNIEPHYNQDSNIIKAYVLVYSYSNQIYHLGSYSLNLFKKAYPNTQNLLLHHHIYDDRYKEIPTKEEAKKKLNLSPTKKYILCFGKFRDKEERNLIINLYNNLKRKNITILAPSFYLVVKRKNLFLFMINSIKYLYYKIKYPYIYMHYMPVEEKDLTTYFSACDIVLIQRNKILNSGNLPLAFYLKKVVVGPNTGNVGEILKETNNPTFNINDSNSLHKSINIALDLSQNNYGEKNYDVCISNYASKTICSKLYKYYTELIRDNCKQSL